MPKRLRGVIIELKSSAPEVIQEAKIKLAEGMENTSSWDVEGWFKALAKLADEHVEVVEVPIKKKVKEEKKEKKETETAPGGEDQTVF